MGLNDSREESIQIHTTTHFMSINNFQEKYLQIIADFDEVYEVNSAKHMKDLFTHV